MASDLIDVWDRKTFDGELGAILAEKADVVRSYMTTDVRIFLAHGLGRGPERSIVRPENPYASAFLALSETIGERMRSRTIRAWHYTRLTAEPLGFLGRLRRAKRAVSRCPVREEPISRGST